MAANPTEYYQYLNSVRTAYSNYVVAHSTDIKENGQKGTDQLRKTVQLNMFEVCLDVLNKFDPTSTVHMFTASEMNDWMTKVNELVNEEYYVEWTQFYA